MNLFIISAFVLCVNLRFGFGLHCEDISGLWQNQLGSNMTIIRRSNNQITGEYSTAVESRSGASKAASNITGLYVPVAGGALLSFTVLFNRGKSLTTWVGQCIECEGEEVLFTSWKLRSLVAKPKDKWMAVNTNQDTFRRVKGSSTNIPFHLRTLGPDPKDEISLDCGKQIKAGLKGHWVSESGNVLEFAECFESGIFSGKHHEDRLLGRSEFSRSFAALGFVSAIEESIKGWTGHIYESSTQSRILETSWLSHSFVDTCKDPSRSVLSGVDEYTFTYGYKGKTTKTESKLTRAWNYFTSFFWS